MDGHPRLVAEHGPVVRDTEERRPAILGRHVLIGIDGEPLHRHQPEPPASEGLVEQDLRLGRVQGRVDQEGGIDVVQPHAP
jgi:hypothetical protein